MTTSTTAAETKPKPKTNPQRPRPPHAIFQRFNSFVHDFQYQSHPQQQDGRGRIIVVGHVVGFGDILYTIIWTLLLGLLIPAIAVPYLWLAYSYKVLSKIFIVFVELLQKEPRQKQQQQEEEQHDRNPLNTQHPQKIVELGIVITGCDSGFGYELVCEMASAPPPPLKNNHKNTNQQRSTLLSRQFSSSSLLLYLDDDDDREGRDDSANTNTIYRYKIFAGCYDVSTAKEKLPPLGGTTSTREGSDETTNDGHVEVDVIPFQLDVTKQSDVDSAVRMVDEWLLLESKQEEATKTKMKTNKTTKTIRLLHAVVNNAGVGRLGQVDWLSIDDYKICMEVNAFGPIRMCKAFMPLLKRQYIQQIEKESRRANSNRKWWSKLSSIYSLLFRPVQYRPRIINLSSAGGIVALGGVGGSAYLMSKYAIDAFTQTFRYEARQWNVDVVSVNPSFHQTPLLTKTSTGMESCDYVREDTRHEYGNEYIEKFAGYVNWCMMSTAWESSNVVYALIEAIETPKPPTQMIVGIDAKYGMCLLRMMPEWFRELFAQIVTRTNVPAIIKDARMAKVDQTPSKHQTLVDSDNMSKKDL